MIDRPCEVYAIRCRKQAKKPIAIGNAFLVEDNKLLTVRHIVEKAYEEGGYEIELRISSTRTIKCKIIGWDGKSFKESTLVVLRPEKDLKMKRLDSAGDSDNKKLLSGMQGYLNWDRKSVSNYGISITSSNIKKTKHKDKKEFYNCEISINNQRLKNFKGLSGAPIYDDNNLPCGIFNAQMAEDGIAIVGLGYCNQAFHASKRKALEMAKRKEKEAQLKDSQPAPSFAEYVADACDDCPDGLRLRTDPSEYTVKYPGRNIQADVDKLNDFLGAIAGAGTEIDEATAKMQRYPALKILHDLYGNNSKRILDVYISGLYNVLLYAYIERKNCPQYLEAAIRLLKVAAEKVPESVLEELPEELRKDFHKDFPQRYLFLAECYLALDKDADAREAIKKVDDLFKPEEMRKTNCYANIQILNTFCRTEEGKEMTNEDVLSALDIAEKNRPEKYECYLCATGAHRMMSIYLANKLKFEDAVDRVKRAYDLDRSADGLEEDYKCFKDIYLKALKHYHQEGFRCYEKWHKFRTYVTKLPLYDGIEGDNLKQQEDEAWISALKRWNSNGRNSNEETLKSTDVLEYAYSYATIPETFETLLQENVHKALFVKVTDCPAENFEELSNGYNDKLSNITGRKGEGAYYLLGGDARLYIYEYQSEAGKTLPVWHLVCVK